MSIGVAWSNPYEETAREIAAARAQLTFRSRHRQGPRGRLRRSDQLLEQVERCRLESRTLVGGSVYAQVAALTGAVDPKLRLALGRHRDPDHVGEILFQVQSRLMRAASTDRQRGLAPVIPLFPSA
ncbi:MAG: hypothetical protein ACREN4_08170 [Candidatus Dormibacteria bacterium]